MSYFLAFMGFVALIVLHEAGHFTAAKMVGMRVERFSLFFGPLLVRFKRGETEYGIGPIPLGGYVRISGMNPREELPPDVVPRAYYNQPVWKRIFVILAGPFVNLVIAFVIVWGLFLSNGQTVASSRVVTVEQHAPATHVLRPGDQLVSVDGVSGDADKLRNQLATHVCAGAQTNGCLAATPAKIVVKRDGQLRTFEIRPKYSSAEHRPLVGFAFGSAQQSIGAVHAASLTVTGMWHVTTQTVSVLGRIFEAKERKQVNGVVGAYVVTQESFAASTTLALEVLALISLSLAVVNLFPFLPLDGGHVFWALAEKVRGKRIPFEVMERAGVVGFVLIVMLFVIGLSNSISTLTGSGFNVH
jgi:regulator of sigma E protease